MGSALIGLCAREIPEDQRLSRDQGPPSGEKECEKTRWRERSERVVGVWEMSLSSTESSLWFGRAPKGSHGFQGLVAPRVCLLFGQQMLDTDVLQGTPSKQGLHGLKSTCAIFKASGCFKFKVWILTTAGFCAHDLSLLRRNKQPRGNMQGPALAHLYNNAMSS